jgi:PEP-CTERM motif
MKSRLRGLAAATLMCWFAAPHEAFALPLISEVFYDAVGIDDGLSFVELHGAPGTDLTGYVIQGINGTGGTVTDTIALSGVIPADGLFVVADGFADGTTQVADADQIASFDFQNGPDSVVLRAGELIFDAVGYGVFAAGDVFAGEGNPSVDPAAGSAIARLFANVDTNDNASDFAAGAPTPGSASFGAVPEPGAGALVGAGLAVLAWQGRRRRPL